jgi:N-acetylglucosamine kinase-like BadF-type ATPase
MILIVDSGSTKTDWLAIDTQTKEQIPYETIGFNPMIQSQSFIQEQISLNISLASQREHIQKIYFFGAGCSSEVNNEKVKNALKTNFPIAQIFVDHDLNGAIIALCQGEPGIACILGTGSNSVYFDGFSQHKKVPSLGYILGDEGSGSYFGKQLIKDYLYLNTPSEISDYIQNELNITKDIVLKKIYSEPNPNRYLASFGPVFSKFRKTSYIQKVLLEGFDTFFKIHVLCFENYKTLPISFVGSIALNFRTELETIAKKYDAKIGNFVQKPIQAIAQYYINMENA